MRYIDEFDAIGPFHAPVLDLVELLATRSSANAEDTAYVFLRDGENESARLTFAELDTRARAIAAHLQNSGMAGERALLLYPPGLDYLEAFFGCLYAGVVAVPAYPPARRQWQRLQSVIADSRPSAVLTITELALRYADDMTELSKRYGAKPIVTDTLAADEAEHWRKPVLTPDSLAFLQYTSGSTGDPKGVMVSHGNLLANQQAIRHGFGHNRQTIVVGWLPLYHDMGLIGNILQPLYLGSTAVLMPPMAFLEKPVRWLQAISAYRASTSGGPNFAYDLCARKVTEEQKRHLDLSCWSLAFNGSEPVYARSLQRFTDAFAECGFRADSFYPCYGLAEATLFVSGEKLPNTTAVLELSSLEGSTAEPGARHQPLTSVACGMPFWGHEVRIVDPVSLQPSAPGTEGEIWVSGPSVAQGYWQRPQESERIFRAQLDAGKSYLRTGDLGVIDDSGFYITGRLKDLIIVRGRNYYPQDIERTLTDVAGTVLTGSCAAFSVQRDDEEQVVVVAEISRNAMRGNDYGALTAELTRALAEALDITVAHFVFVSPGAVPKTSSGKIRRSACKQLYLEGKLKVQFDSGAAASADRADGGSRVLQLQPDMQLLREALSAAPQGQRAPIIVRFLANTAARLLKADTARLSREQSLTAFGLDSLKAVELKYAVDESLGVESPLSLYLSDQSLANVADTLADGLEAAYAENGERAVPFESTRDADGLSATQRAIWTMQHMEPDSVVYNLHLALRIEAPIDTEALRCAVLRLVERHALLRMQYRVDGGDVKQRLPPPDELPAFLVCVDASAWSEAEFQDDMARRVHEPFDLECGPIVRTTLYRHASDVFTLLFCTHHIAVDLWSTLILVDELERIYASPDAVRPAIPAPTYADFTAWQLRYLTSSDDDWHYWRQCLAGELPILAMPTDRPRPKVADYRGATRAVRLDKQETGRLKALASRYGVTLFTLLLAAYKVFLFRYSRQTDLIVGVPTSGRSQARFASVVGNFVNTIPLRTRPRGDQPFSAYLREVQAALLGGLEHQNFPFSTLVDRLKVERNAGQWPIYQTLFMLQQTQAGMDADLAQLALGEDGDVSFRRAWRLRPLAIRHRVENFDFKLMAAEIQDGLLLSFQYRCGLFDADTIESWGAQFRHLLGGIVSDPDSCLGELPLLLPCEFRRITALWNETDTCYDGAESLHGLFEQQAAKTPDAVALVYEDQRLSYRALNEQANRWAYGLIRSGVCRDRPVGICMQRSMDMVIAMLAVLKAGGAYLPLDPDYPKDRLAIMLADAQASLILAQQRFEKNLPGFDGEIVCVDAENARFRNHVVANPDVAVEPATLAYVLFTSGSTGTPKGVGIPHAGVRNRLLWMQQQFGLDSTDAVLQKTPYTFDVSVWEFFWPLLAGARLVILEPDAHKDPDRLVAAIRRSGVTTLHFVPSMLNAFLAVADMGLCPTLRRVLCSGEALSAELRQRFFESSTAELHNLYGPTEASIDVTACALERKPAGAVPIGRPIANTRIYLLDERYNPVPVNVPGELYIAGIQLARGYLNRPDLTAERFVPDPFSSDGGRLYKTGDLACYRPDGVIEYLGRIDHQVKIRGFRIEPAEVEAKLAAHLAVRDAAVVVKEDHRGGKCLVAYWVEAASGEDDIDWPGYLLASLPDYMIPAAFVKLHELPLTANGKLDRKSLPAPDFGERQAAGYVAPRTPVEKTLAEIWTQVLPVERVGIHDNFFALAGDSILAILVVSNARKAGLRLTPRQLFQYQTVAELAEAAVPLAGVHDEQGPVTGVVPLLPIQRGFFEQNFAHPHHWNQALMLKVRTALEPGALKQAVGRLVVQHDALRLRFTHEEHGWVQYGVAEESAAVLQRIDLTDVPNALLSVRLEQECRRWQASLNIVDGPLFRVVWFNLGADRCDRLLVVIHHLVVDGVSWRILLEDLQTAYRFAVQDGTVALPAKTTSFKQWSERLQASGAAQQELGYWLDVVSAPVQPLPVDFPDGSRLEGRTGTVSVDLDAGRTASLLRDASAAYRTRVGDLLLTALGLALSAWSGDARVRIDVEGHGREELFDDMDLSRTVGWFTSIYPVLLELPPNIEAGAAITAVKEQRLRIPRHGIGFGSLRYAASGSVAQRLDDTASSVLFNYLGQFDHLLADSALFVPVDEVGACRDPNNARAYELEINARILGGRLVIEWHYSTERYRESTIPALAERCLANLQALIAHCLLPEAGALSPGDFPLSELSPADLGGLPYPPRHIEDIYPLSPMQQGMLFDTLLAPRSGIYLMQDRFKIQGRVDEEIFRQAWQRVLNRQPVLRSVFAWKTNTNPHQIVLKHVKLPFDYLDWRAIPGQEQETRLETLLAAEREQGFDFTEAPLMAIRLIRIAEAEYYFVRSYHHILVDAWCLSLMLVELNEHYEDLVRGQTVHQKNAPSFRDYIAWLRQRDAAATEAFWRNYLRGFAEPTPIPVGKSTRKDLGKDATVCDAIITLSEQETRDLNDLAHRLRLTPNTLIQAAWALMLNRYSGADEVVFGVTVAGRPTELAGSDMMLGVFINSLPLRVKVRPEQPLLDFLDDLLRQNLEIRQFEYAPLLSIQGWSEMPRGLPLFESLLVFENYPIDPRLRTGGNGLNIVDVKTRTHTNYPLNGMVIPGDRLHLQITYHTDRFEQTAVERMLRHFRNLLAAMVDAPEKRIGELPMLAASECECLLTDWNRTHHDYQDPCDFVARFEKQAEQTPDAIAVACSDQRLSYRELNSRANCLAHGLIAQGVGPDSLVALLSDRGIGFASMMLAVFKSGGAYLPLDPAHPDGRLQQVLNESLAAWLLVGTEHRERSDSLFSGEADTAASQSGDSAMPAFRPAVLSSEQLAGLHADCRHNPTRRHGAGQLAFVIFTSGSTGTPKGAMVEHRGMFNNLITKVPTLGLTEADVIAQTAGQCFDISVWQHLTALALGARVEIFPDEVVRDPNRLLRQLAEKNVTVLEAVPSMIQALLELADIGLPNLRWLMACGEAFPPELCRRWMLRFPHTRVLNAYGPAECSDDVSYHEITDIPGETDALVPIGRPVHNTRLYLLNRCLDPVPVGVPGEICVAGIQVGRGYWGRPELTAEKFVPDAYGGSGGRLYRTGDLGRYREDGTLEFLGRTDHQVKIRGVRVEPGEIEAQLLNCPSVAQALVTVGDDGNNGKRLLAYVVCNTEATANDTELAAKLREHLSAGLPNAMLPSVFIRLSAMPLGVNGKIDRKALPEPHIGEQSGRVYVAPRTSAQAVLAEIWHEVLGVEQVGVEDNFFDLGGHSLSAVRVMSRIRAAFGVEVPLRRVFEAATISQLAAVLEDCLIEQIDALSEEEAQALLEDEP